MAVSADRVIVEIEAKIAKYTQDLKVATAKTEAAHKAIAKAATDAEKAVLKAALDRAKAEEAASRRIAEAAEKARLRAVIAAANEQKKIAALGQRKAELEAAQRAKVEAAAAAAAQRRAAAELQNATKAERAAQVSAQKKAEAELRAAAKAEESARRAADRAATASEKAKQREIAASNKAALAAEKAKQREAASAEKAAERKAKAAERAANVEARAARRAADAQKKASNDAERQILQRSTAISGSLKNLAGSYSRLLTVAGIGILAKRFIDLADANKKLEATLRLATAQFGSFNQAQEDVSRLATETRANINDTAKIYAAFTRIAAESGITQEQASRATETFAKSLKIGGATAVEAASATLQFNQALGSGVLRGEEFNAVNEASVRTTKLLAESLGVPQGALRKLAEEGKLTRDVLINALVNTKYTKGIDEEFKVLPVTVGDSLVLVKNAAQQTFGAFDRGGEFSTALANFFKDGAKGFGDLSGDAEQFGREVRAVLEGLGDTFQPFIDAGKAAFDLLGADSASISQQIRQDIRNIAAAYDALNAFGANTIGTARTNVVGDFDRRVAASQRKAAIVKGGDGLRALINVQNARNGLGPQRAAVASAGSGKKARGPKGKSPEQIADEELRNERDFLDALRRLRAEQLQNELDVTTDGEKRLAIQGELAELERESRIAAINADKSLTEARRKRLLEETNKAFGLEADGTTINTSFNTLAQKRLQELDERNLELAQISLRDKIDTLQTDADLSSSRTERLAIQRRILELEQQEERDNLELAIKRGEIIDAEDARLRLKQRQGNASERVERDNESPLQRFRREVGEVGNNINDELEKVQVDGLNELNDGLVDAITGAKSLGDVFSDVANSIIKDLLRIAVQQAIIGPLAGGGGFFGALLGAIPSVAGAAFGGGGRGVAGADGVSGLNLGAFGVSKRVGDFNTTISNAAPRRASGGNVVAGKLYEINENGTELFQPSQSGKIYPTGSLKARGGGGGTVVIAPQQFDLSGVVMTEDLVAQIDARNRAYTDQVGRTAIAQAIRGSGPYNDQQRKLRG